MCYGAVAMEVIAITREVSPNINQCELSFHAREPIDLDKAIAQHKAYQECLRQLGARIISLPAEPHLPDSVFVEDAAVVLDEVAVIPILGAPSRRQETAALAEILSLYRPAKFLAAPATLDGGDVLRAGRRIFIGLSQRTNREGIQQFREIVQPYGYEVEAGEVRNILHLKSACSYLGDDMMLINRSFVNTEMFEGFDLIEVPVGEPAAANALTLNGTVILSAAFPLTRSLLASRGLEVVTVDVSEMQKAEAGVTCCSVILEIKEALNERDSASAAQALRAPIGGANKALTNNGLGETRDGKGKFS